VQIKTGADHRKRWLVACLQLGAWLGISEQVFETFFNCSLIPKGCHYYSMIQSEKSIKYNPEGLPAGGT
jgi:hypothetical protein